MTIFNIERAFQQKKERNWPKLFWCIDLHDVIIAGKYNKFNVGAELFPGAQEVLQNLYARSDMCLILWTSSHNDALKNITDRLYFSYGIKFHYFSENPECPNTELCDFSKKFYFNILLEDKSSFDGPGGDWNLIKQELIRIGEWFPKTDLILPEGMIALDPSDTSYYYLDAGYTPEQVKERAEMDKKLTKYEKKDDLANVDALKARLDVMKDQTD